MRITIKNNQFFFVRHIFSIITQNNILFNYSVFFSDDINKSKFNNGAA